MSLAVYRVLTPYTLPVDTGDQTGKLPATVQVASGELFVGDATQPQIVKYLAENAIVLVIADPTGILASIGVPVGMNGTELAIQVVTYIINFC